MKLPKVATPQYHLSNVYKGTENPKNTDPKLGVVDNYEHPPSPLDLPPSLPHDSHSSSYSSNKTSQK
jgi:hypothetical protein